MTRITYVQADGSARTIEAAPGSTVMEAAIDNDIEGIVAECGGACSCATCHVYVDEGWVERTGEPDAMEDGMLDCVLDRRPTSRLSCQIPVREEIDGLVVYVPENQL
jgi:2Fe-2S ferredoxin